MEETPKKMNLLLAAGLLIGLFSGGCGEPPGNPEQQPNIIFVTVDTLRADHLSCYGYGRKTSPRIDALAEDGLLFTRCFSHAPVTSSSLASMMSGFLPHETKVLENLPVPKQVKLLPEFLKEQGYTTVGVVSNFVLRQKKGWSAGFDIYNDEMSKLTMNKQMPERIAEETTQRALNLLEQHKNEKLFMWIHYQDPHGPYNPPDRYDEFFQHADLEPRLLEVNDTQSGSNGIPTYQKLENNRNYHYYVSRYDREIRYFDDQFGLLIDSLKKRGLYENALIIFTADHGEGMGEKDYYFAHGENLSNSLIHVPLILKKGNVLKGRREDFVQHLDLVPTVLSVAGIQGDSRFRGADLCTPVEAGRELVAEMQSPIASERVKLSLIKNGMKLVYAPGSKTIALFDLNTDLLEEKNIANEPANKQLLIDLIKLLKHSAREDRLKLKIVNKQIPISEDDLEMIKRLGYAQ